MPVGIYSSGVWKKYSKCCGLGRALGLFMASTDGLMGYGYEIRLHNSKQVRGLQTWAERVDRSADSPPLPGELQGQQPQPQSKQWNIMGYEWSAESGETADLSSRVMSR